MRSARLIDLRGRTLRHSPWPVDIDGAQRRPNLFERRSIFRVTGHQVRSVLTTFLKRGGRIDALVERMNGSMPSGFHVTADSLLHSGCCYTDELYFFLVHHAKNALRDPNFLDPDGPWALQHPARIFEQGHLRSPASVRSSMLSNHPVRALLVSAITTSLQRHAPARDLDDLFDWCNAYLPRSDKALRPEDFRSAALWISLEFLVLFMSIVDVIFPSRETVVQAFGDGMDPKIVSLLRLAGSPGSVLRRFAPMARVFCSFIRYETRIVGHGIGTFQYRIGDDALARLGPYASSYLHHAASIHEGILRGWSGAFGPIYSTEVQLDPASGGDHVHFRATLRWWLRAASWLRSARGWLYPGLGLIGPVVAAMLAGTLLLIHPIQALVLGVASGVPASLALFRFYRERADIAEYWARIDESSVDVIDRAEQLDLEVRRLTDEKRDQLRRLFTALAKAIEAKDCETERHVLAVSYYSRTLAEGLELDEATIRDLSLGAIVHDIGKIGVPNQILLKPGELNPDERKVIQLHAEHGYEIVKAMAGMEAMKNVVRFHHERFDGSGYPHGLSGESIPVEARIVAIADVWDALTSSRPYRVALSVQEAFRRMRSGRGTHFDPAILDRFFDLGFGRNEKLQYNEVRATVSSPGCLDLYDWEDEADVAAACGCAE